jgi:hypothetical protein
LYGRLTRGAVVCSWSLLIRWAQRARHQAETPPIPLPKFPGPALIILPICDVSYLLFVHKVSDHSESLHKHFWRGSFFRVIITDKRLKVADQMPSSQRHLTTHLVDFWLARGAILVIVGLQIGIVNDLTVGPRWFAPCLELALLIPLSVGTAWVQKRARKASTDKQRHSVGDLRRMLRRLALVLTAVITLMNSGALIRLIAAMLSGHAGTGRTLLLDSLNIWVTNVVLFALWFWALDRGGPAAKGLVLEQKNDFLFAQQQTTFAHTQFPNWSPGFVDYLFLAFTTATAFSPADTLPLTVRAKLLMMAESAISLATIALVASRAVGILS